MPGNISIPFLCCVVVVVWFDDLTCEGNENCNKRIKNCISLLFRFRDIWSIKSLEESRKKVLSWQTRRQDWMNFNQVRGCKYMIDWKMILKRSNCLKTLKHQNQEVLKRLTGNLQVQLWSLSWWGTRLFYRFFTSCPLGFHITLKTNKKDTNIRN